VRDGRSASESLARSFKLSFNMAVRWWIYGAGEILKFQKLDHPPEHKLLYVRYEDLCNNLEGEMRKILTFLNLDAERYDFAAANNSPVLGSSTLRGDSERVTWQPIAKTDDFDPVNRWQQWKREKHARFNFVAGQYNEQLGYQNQTLGFNPFWAAWGFFHMIFGVVSNNLFYAIFQIYKGLFLKKNIEGANLDGWLRKKFFRPKRKKVQSAKEGNL
jgi:hypothetical protein